MHNQLAELVKHQAEEEKMEPSNPNRFALKKQSKAGAKPNSQLNKAAIEKHLVMEKQKSENVRIDDSIGIIGNGISKGSKPTTNQKSKGRA